MLALLLALAAHCAHAAAPPHVTVVAGRDVVSFDYGWRFHAGDPSAPPPAPPPPASCADPSAIFTANVSGRAYENLNGVANATTAAQCAETCCSFDEPFVPRCWVWQWVEHVPANYSHPRCAIGHPKDTRKFTNDSTLLAFSRAVPPPPGPSPPLPLEPAAAATGFEDSSWERVDLPHDMLMANPYDPVKKRHFLRHLYVKCIILSRQARDKHKENSKKSGVSLGHAASRPQLCASFLTALRPARRDRPGLPTEDRRLLPQALPPPE